MTLTGSAGVGKTRLALAVAAEALDAQPGGVWWVELAPLADPERRRSRRPGRPRRSTQSRRHGGPTSWRSRSATSRRLLVLDNCEHLIAGCAELVADLLGGQSVHVGADHQPRAPRGAGRDHLAGAVVALPGPRATPSTSPTLSQYDAVVLFVERARRARPSFAVSEANAACHRARSVTASTASRSPSSWPPPAAGRCPPSASPPSSTTGSGC